MVALLSAAWYFLNATWVRGLLLLNTSRKVQGKANVPRHGAFILASNHLNNADPPILTGTTPRRIVWMTKAEWFKTPVIGGMFRMARFIPVRRFEADLQALRKAQDALREGLVLGMFPEGTRSRTGTLGTPEPGTALIALRTGAQIVPVAIWGTERVKLPRAIIGRTRVWVSFGKPFSLPQPKRITKAEVAAAADAIMNEIAKLLPPQYRGPYADAGGEAAKATAEGKS